MKKIIVAGGRDFTDKGLLYSVLDNHIKEPCIIVSGKCETGADYIGEQYAKDKGYEILSFPADWKKYKNAAGPIRNKQMVDVADELILFYDGKSKGSTNIKGHAERKGIPLTIIRY